MQKETNKQAKPNPNHTQRQSYASPTTTKKFNEQSLHVTVESVEIGSGVHYDPDYPSELAIKNHSSFFIATHKTGAVLVENRAVVYSDECKIKDEDYLCDIIYIKDLDCYLMLAAYSLYRKDIDDQPPYRFMELKHSVRYRSCLRYSGLNKMLILSDFEGDVFLIDLKRKQIQFKAKKRPGRFMLAFKLFGEKENKMITLTNEGYIIIHAVSYQMRKVLGIQKIKFSDPGGRSIAVCDQNHLVLVQGHDRMILFKLEANSLTQIACFDQNYFVPDFNCFGCVGTHVLWIGLCYDLSGSGSIFISDYDIDKKKLKDLVAKRVPMPNFFREKS